MTERKTPIVDKMIEAHGQEQFYGGTKENIGRLVWDEYQELQRCARALEQHTQALAEAVDDLALKKGMCNCERCKKGNKALAGWGAFKKGVVG